MNINQADIDRALADMLTIFSGADGGVQFCNFKFLILQTILDQLDTELGQRAAKQIMDFHRIISHGMVK
jgi:hypothetical protein